MRSRDAGGFYKVGVLFALASIFVSVGRSDIGGGSGKPLSPYSRFRADEITASLVQEKKTAAASKKSILSLPIAHGDIEPGIISQIGLAYANAGRIEGNVLYEFQGVTEDAEEVSVPFSEISSFEVLGEENGKLVVELKRFPAIEPEELIKRQPTYLQLRKEFTKLVLLRMALRNPSGAVLELVGSRKGKKAEPIIPLNNIAPGRTVVFYEPLFDDEAYWWAIPSVTKDPAYPYRVVTKK